MKIRLAKALSQAGVASRRACETLILEGKVRVNGEVVSIPQTQVDPAHDRIEVGRKRVPKAPKKVYYILNKPPGYLCSTARTSKHAKLALDLIETADQRLFTVGRLDKETGGLLLVTNDGEFAHQILHPSFGITKEYLIKARQEISDVHLKALSEGAIVEGVHVKPLKVKKVRKGTLKIVLAEGRKREVRQLVEEAGLTLLELTRIRIGPLSLGNLSLGEWRPLTRGEQELLIKN